MSEAAGQFLARYPAIYAECCAGAVYLVKPVRDYAAACELVRGWPDQGHLTAMLRVFLARADRLKPGTPAQFLALAPDIDREVRGGRLGAKSGGQQGRCPHTPRCRTLDACIAQTLAEAP